MNCTVNRSGNTCGKETKGMRIELLNGHSRLYFDHAINEPDKHYARNGDCHFSFILHIFSYASDEARVLFGTRVSSHDTRAKLRACHLAHHPRQRQTKATEILFVLLFKYAHSRDIMTRLACRVMARVPVCSPFTQSLVKEKVTMIST